MPEQRQETDAMVLRPRADTFETKDAIDNSIMNAGQRFAVYDRTEYPPEGGIYVWYKGMPYPKKGFPFPEAIHAVNMVKRITLTLSKAFAQKELAFSYFGFIILPWKMKKRVIKKIVADYDSLTMMILRGAYLKESYYSNPCKSLKKITRIFIEQLGLKFSEDTMWNIQHSIVSIFEYDDAYRFRFQDIFTEASHSALISRPYREIRRLAKIAKKRENTHAVRAIGTFSQLLSVMVLYPPVRRAFKRAIRSLTVDEFKKLQLDNADRYHVLMRGDYNYTGRTFEERREIFLDVHRVSECCKAKVTKRDEILPPDWICSKCKLMCTVGFIFPPEIEIAPEKQNG